MPLYLFLRSTLFFVGLTLIVSCGSDKDPDRQRLEELGYTEADLEIISAIDEAGHQISAPPLIIPNSQLSVLDELSDARIVGLGEATHGTREFFQMKHRVFQYLVEEHGFDAFIFEMDLGEARVFNDWVQGRRDDDIDRLMADKMIFWTWRTEEVRELLEWIRDFNTGRSDADMIGFYGVDTQFPGFDIEQLDDMLIAMGDPVGGTLKTQAPTYLDIWDNYRNNSSDAIVASVINEIKLVKSIIEERANTIKDQLGEDELKWANQLVLHMEQVQQVVFDNVRNQRYHSRDQYMADNTSWYFDLLGEERQFVLWAHNGHLADNYRYAGIYGGSQGSYLKEIYQEDYQIVGFSFGKGSFTAVQSGGSLRTHTITEEPSTGSYTAFFYETSLDNFILPLTGQGESLQGWLNKENRLLMLGAVFDGNASRYYSTFTLSAHYDYIIHFDNTLQSVLIR